MKKGVVLVLACSVVAVGLYFMSPSHKGTIPSPQPEAPIEIAKNVEPLLASESRSGNAQLPPELEDLVNDLDTQLAQEDEGISAPRQQPPQVREPENVAEQAQLALEMGYIDDSQLPEFHRQREHLNSIIQEQQESEMAQALEEGVSP